MAATSAGSLQLISSVVRRNLTRTRLATYAFPLVAALVVAGFLLFPLPLNEKAHGALHGLCAQTPSHSYVLGGQRLPFDARMTGIYGGFGVAFALLAYRGRLRCLALPNWRILAVLGLFVAAMGIDGTNSLLLDMGHWHPYQPRNDLRLFSGLLTGIALAVAVCFLLSTTLWRRGRHDSAIVSDFPELGLMIVLQVPVAVAVAAGPAWFYAPLAIGLVLTATAVVTSLTLVMSTIALRRDGTFGSFAELGPSAVVALALAMVVMGSIAGGRFWLEHMFGLQAIQ
jgi:uncharacterized membrane protein